MAKVHRFIGNFNITEFTLTITEREFVNQVRNVLRLNVGEELILSSGSAEEARAKITSYGNKYVEVSILERMKNTREPKRSVTLYLSVLKRENFELAAQKATEVGVARIVPVISARTVKMNINKERVEKITKEAAEQSGRGVVPGIASAMSFEEALIDAKKNDLALFFDAEGKEFKYSVLDKIKSVGIFVGPEGGWTNEEIEKSKEAKLISINLGALTLRAETAVTVASYLVCQ